eukprot:gene17179-18908_t
MDDSNKEITGYVHNVSVVGAGSSKKYFDFHVQTDKDVVRAACFCPSERKTFNDLSSKQSPVKIKKFILDKDENSTDILVNDKLVIEEVESVDFQRKQLIPTELTIEKLTAIAPEQIITLKAKVINLQKVSKGKINTDNLLTKREGLLLDPSGCIKLFSGKMMSKKLRKEEHTTAEEFPADTLTPPQTIPTELITSTITGEVIGVNKAVLNFCCFICNKPVDPDSKRIVYCQSCKMKQKFSKCKKQWYVNAVVCNENDAKAILNFYNEIVHKILEQFSPSNANTEDESIMEEVLVDLPVLTFIFNEKTRAMNSFTQSCDSE